MPLLSSQDTVETGAVALANVAAEEAGESLWELLAVGAVADEAVPVPRDALGTADGFDRETGENLHEEVVGEVGKGAAHLVGVIHPWRLANLRNTEYMTDITDPWREKGTGR
jgi:hypothetical protein